MSEHLTENIKLRLDSETMDELRRLAAEGDRTIVQQIRRMIRQQLVSEQKAPA